MVDVVFLLGVAAGATVPVEAWLGVSDDTPTTGEGIGTTWWDDDEVAEIPVARRFTAFISTAVDDRRGAKGSSSFSSSSLRADALPSAVVSLLRDAGSSRSSLPSSLPSVNTSWL